MRFGRSCESRDPGELRVAFGYARTVIDGLSDAATLLKQRERRRLIATSACRRRKQRKGLGLAPLNRMDSPCAALVPRPFIPRQA